jgi:hypothetical protein
VFQNLAVKNCAVSFVVESLIFMKLYFGPKIYDIVSLRYLAVVSFLLMSVIATSVARAQSTPAPVLPPAISSVPLPVLVAQRTAALRKTLQPTLADYLPTVSSAQDIKASSFGLTAEDAPVPGTASPVSSFEQTFDLTLGADVVLGPSPLSTTTGIPTKPTPYYTDVTWSHVGNYIIFSAVAPGSTKYHLYAMLANGGSIGTSAVEQLTSGNNNERYPSLEGPNDTTIVYCSDDNAGNAYELVQANFGTSASGLTISDPVALAPTLQARHPFVDGGAVYFAGRPIGEAGTIAPYDIYEVNGGFVTQLTGGGSDNDNPVVTSAGSGYIAWDSNAQGFTFSTSNNAGYVLTPTSVSAFRNIYAATIAGANVQAMTVAGSYTNEFPQWSTDVSPNSFVSSAYARDLFFDSNRPNLSGSNISVLYGTPSNNSTYHLYYVQAISANSNNTSSVTPESTSNESIQVNTSDPSGYTAGFTPTGLSNQFDDVEPTLSQLDGAYVSVAYISNRYLINHNYDNPLLNNSLANSTTLQTANSETTLGVGTTLSSYPSATGGVTPAGVTTLDVNSVTGSGSSNVFFPGQTVYIDQGNVNFESGVVSSVNNVGQATITLVSTTANPHLAGATVIAASTTTTAAVPASSPTVPVVLPVTSVEGFVVGSTLEIDSGLSTDEFAVVTAIGTSSVTVSSLVYAHVSGASVRPTVDEEPSSVPLQVSSAFGSASEILVSRLLDVTQPTLVNYNAGTDEIVHVFKGALYGPTGATNYNPVAAPTRYVPAGSPATFVVRLSDRQTGIGQAWLQIKDPNSFTQDATGIEHKVYSEQPPIDFYGENSTPYAEPQKFRSTYDEATTLWNFYPPPSNYNYVSWGLNDWPEAYIGTDGANNPIKVGSEVTTDLAKNFNQTINEIPTHTTLLAMAAAASMSITVATPQNIAVLAPGDEIEIGAGATAEVQKIVGVSGDVITLVGPLGTFYSHAMGEPVRYVVIGSTSSAAVPPTGQTPPQFTVPVTSSAAFSIGDVVEIGMPPQVGAEEATVVAIPSKTSIELEESLNEEPFQNIENLGLEGSYATATDVVIVATSDFDPLGHEIDCEAINTNLQANDPATGNDLISNLPSSYVIPTFTPGWDDALGFDEAMTEPNAPGLLENQNPGVPTYWLRLNPLPPNLQDGNGGVLYYGTWTTPSTGSDYYLDVITEDGSASENWEIYDNVWGFNTVTFQPKNHILVVNDFALPEKFYYWQNIRNNPNASPAPAPYTVYGTESYWTDINTDVSDWQNFYALDPSVQQVTQGGSGPTVVLPTVAEEWTYSNPIHLVQRAKMLYGYDLGYGTPAGPFYPAYANGLGVNSYYDQDMSQQTFITSGNTNVPVANSQKYDIWRILSRGPIPLSTLNSYGATHVTQPADPFTGTAAKSVVVSPSCVVWLSPYAGDTETIQGTIVDPNTQINLESFLNNGGRLHIEGKNIGFALTEGGGVSNTFYNTYLNDFPAGSASAYISDDTGNADDVYKLIAGAATTDQISNDAFTNSVHQDFVYPVNGIGVYTYKPPSSQTVDVSHIIDNNINPADTFDTTMVSDGAMDDEAYAFYSFIDGFNTDGTKELTGTTDYEEYYNNTTNGSIVSYSSFGIAELSQIGANFAQTGLMVAPPIYALSDQRTRIIHNIVCTLRTGSITGTVTSTSAQNSGLAGAVVEAVLTGAPAKSPTYTAVSTAGGAYTIVGLPDGNYTLNAYLEGFTYQHTGNLATNIHGGDSATVSLALSSVPGGSLVVTVEYGTGTSATLISGAVVTLTPFSSTTGSSSATVPSAQTTNAQGVATFASVPAGQYYISVSASGYATVTNAGPVTIVSSQQTSYTVNLLQQPSTITGTVTAAGSPSTTISNATITLTNASGTPLSLNGSEITAQTNSNGVYTFNITATTLPVGTSVVYLVASAPGYASSLPLPSVGIDPVGGQTYTQNFQLGTETTLDVLLVDSLTGLGVPNVDVTATGAQTFPATASNSSGLVTFAPAAAGTYTVTPVVSSYQAAGYTSASPAIATVTVPSGGVGSVTITLTPSVGTLTGTVTDAYTGAPISGATVVATNSAASTTTFTATTNSSGIYDIPNVRVGTYTLTASASGHTSQTITGVSVAAGATQTQNFILAVPSIHTFAAGLQMISAPYDYTGIPLSQVLDGDIDATNNDAPNVIAAWLPLDGAYVKSPTPPCDTLHIGQGYWARFGANGGAVISTGTAASTSPAPEILLNPGWNMIGDPFTSTTPLASLGFYDSRGLGDPSKNNAPYTFATASGSLALVSPTLYTYDTSSGQYVPVNVGNTGSGGDGLAPWVGYWIEAFSTTTLVF